jgi:hypothetical protein
MSNRERIARAAEEAQLKAAEKAAKKPERPAAAARPRRSATAPVRMKVVWEICTGSGAVVKTFGYAEKNEAEAELAKLTKAGRTHVLRPTKVPME